MSESEGDRAQVMAANVRRDLIVIGASAGGIAAM